MPIDDDNAQHTLLDAGSPGSDECISVLLAMNRWNAPTTLGDLSNLTRLHRRQLQDALRGLMQRERVVQTGEGSRLRFELAHRVRPQQQAPAA